MAYPEPIPELKGKDAREFLKRLKNFKLTEEQKEFYRDALEKFGCRDDCIGKWKLGYCVGCNRYPNPKDKYSNDISHCRCNLCEPIVP
jgi:hypothetical protein